MIAKEAAIEVVYSLLRKIEAQMHNFGSALPGSSEKIKPELVISRIDEHTDIGWVFFYNSKAYVENGEFEHALVGNAPLIVEKATGNVYSSGTARPIEFFLDEFRRGIRRPLLD